ncbi:MAG: hypothetical protein WC238_03945 [Parcubacteria group bacterium]|jgi:hypothetical protein
MENMEDENKVEEGTETNTASSWIQDNLRIIISVLIVVLIAGGIYSYSKRTATPTDDQTSQGVITQQDESDKNNAAITPDTSKSKQVVDSATSQETENSFVETAGKGDGTTVLARRALANYLEKNPDSALTPEHKIYIEDFLRKSVPKKAVHVGTSVEFSKDLVQNAIGKSKTLNDRQLQNLHKYAVRVPSLS